MTTFQLLLLCVYLWTGKVASESCQGEGWDLFEGSCYKFGRRQVTWVTARAKCKDMGGYLAEITSRDEQDFLYEQRDWIGLLGDGWIGLNDRDKEDTLVWEHTGLPLRGYTDWIPSDWGYSKGDNETRDCVQLMIYNYWVTRNCDEKKFYFCERAADQ